MIKKSLVLFLSVALAVLPISQAHADFIVPAGMERLALAAAGGGSGAETTIATLAASGGSSANPLGVGLAALAVGAAVGYFGLDYLVPDDNSLSPRLIVPLAKSIGARLPAPTAPATATVVSTNQPGQICFVSELNPANRNCAATACEAASPFFVNYINATRVSVKFTSDYVQSGRPACTVVYNTSSGGTEGVQMFSSDSTPATVVYSCPSGYSLSGQTCNLIDASAAVSDGRVDVQTNPTDGVYTPVTDADAQPVAAKPEISADGKNLKYHGYVKSSDGVKHDIWLDSTSSNSGASYSLNVSYIDPAVAAPQNDTGSADFWSFEGGTWGGPTLTNQGRVLPIKTTTVQVDNGIVTGVSRNTTTGVIAEEGTTYTDSAGVSQTVKPQQLVVTAPTTTTGATPVQVTPSTTVTPTTQAVTIPTDYARQGEAQTAANTIKNKLDETAPDTDLTEPVLSNPLVNHFNPLRSWVVPTVAGSCPAAGSFSWDNNTYSFNVICDLFNQHLPLIQSVMSVLYALAALFIVLGA